MCACYLHTNTTARTHDVSYLSSVWQVRVACFFKTRFAHVSHVRMYTRKMSRFQFPDRRAFGIRCRGVPTIPLAAERVSHDGPDGRTIKRSEHKCGQARKLGVFVRILLRIKCYTNTVRCGPSMVAITAAFAPTKGTRINIQIIHIRESVENIVPDRNGN